MDDLVEPGRLEQDDHRPSSDVSPSSHHQYSHPNGESCAHAGGIGHRVRAGASVLALVLDEERVFGGLQGGVIMVCLEPIVCDSASSNG
jgi:hypothetical protein